MSAHSGKRLASMADPELETETLESLLVEKKLVSTDALDKLAAIYEKDIGPMNGARVVARAWTNSSYRKRLLKDATAAIAELGFGGLQGEDMVVVENTPKVHNIVVCTLCSCYPWPVLGLPPAWYKSPAYRSRVVIDPRGVLREFGLAVNANIKIRIWDSTSEVRYMVLPERPSGTHAMSENRLATLVTREALIGVARVKNTKLSKLRS